MDQFMTESSVDSPFCHGNAPSPSSASACNEEPLQADCCTMRQGVTIAVWFESSGL